MSRKSSSESKGSNQRGSSKANKKAVVAKKTTVDASIVVMEPKRSDILCGKDKSCVSHEGSVNFRKMIDLYRERYCSETTTKQERMSITKEIVAKLLKTSRFLKYDSKDQVWKTITPLAARDKVSHALRFANLKENRKNGNAKDNSSRPSRRRVSVSSSGSSGSTKKAQSPEDEKFWNSLVSRQAKLLEKIKKGEKGSIPEIVELPQLVGTSSVVQEEQTKYDPLSIDDNSFEENPSFQDYCLQLYRSEEPGDTTSVPGIEDQDRDDVAKNSFLYQYMEAGDCQSPDEDSTNGDAEQSEQQCIYEDQSKNSDSPGIISQQSSNSDDIGDEISSMITEPLMAWDLEHDGLFEEV